MRKLFHITCFCSRFLETSVKNVTLYHNTTYIKKFKITNNTFFLDKLSYQYNLNKEKSFKDVHEFEYSYLVEEIVS